MAIVLTSNPCFGLTFGFALQRSLSAGVGLSPSLLTCWYELATSQEQGSHPWENCHREPTVATSASRDEQIVATVGHPCSPPQPRGKSPGRAKGVKISKAKRFPVVRQVPKMPPLVPI